MSALFNKKRKVLNFSGEFEALIGKPEMKGSWLISGHSGNGKTAFALKLGKYFAKLGLKVNYNSLEEGDSQSFEMACRRECMNEVSAKFHLIQDETKEMLERIRAKRSADVWIIDSIQFLGLSYAEYKDLLKEFPDKLFILISHAEGKKPKGRVAQAIEYDAFVKIWVANYIATAKSRYGGKEAYVIWEERAKELGEI